MNILPTSQWQRQREDRLARLRPVVEAHLERASRHEKHPVIDFLFQYYSFSPSQLMTWSPGAGVVLEGDAECMISCGGRTSPSAKAERPARAGGSRRPEELRPPEWWVRTSNGWEVDVSAFPEKRRLGLEWVIQLLESLEVNPPRFGCHGLHEWAMVYKASDKKVRHCSFPLRLPMNQIEELVNTQPIQCTHYDAFRFFMPDAKPLNRFQPQHTNRFELEQSGCIHVNMDHYKWAYKYYPWISTDRVADAFELAIDARSIDMRASPYDLRSLGYEPILIETPAGREQYQAEQRRLQQAGSILRAALVKDLKHLLESIPVWA